MIRADLDPDLRNAFTRVGVAHVLAISGLHIGLIALVAYGAWRWLLARSQYVLLMWSVPKPAAFLTLPVVLLYAGLAGGSVSTLRAVIMVAVFLIARLLDREEEVFRSLALGRPDRVVDLAGGPSSISSFQLSFVAVLAIFLACIASESGGIIEIKCELAAPLNGGSESGAGSASTVLLL